MPDPYEIIGVRRDASLDEIRITYRRSAQVLHPDRFATASDGVRSEAAHRMLQLNSAMEEIEDERADEASGTGTLGHVTFGDRPPVPTTSETPLADRRAAPRPGPAPAPEIVLRPDVTPARVDAPGAPEPEPAIAVPEPDELVVSRQPVPPPPAHVEPAPPVPPRAPEPAPSPYALGAERTFGYDDDDDDDDDRRRQPEREIYIRPTRRNSRPSRIHLVIVGVVAVVALAVIAGYFVLRGGSSGEQTFAKAGAPFTFKYPNDFRARRLDGGVALNRPTYQVGYGIDADNYLLASTYKLGFTVQDDGSATGPKGQQLTPNQIDHDIDVTIAKLAEQAGFTQKSVESGSLGSLRARIYDYAKPDGSLASTFVVALQGKTEYYVTCQSSPRGAARITKACDRLLATFAPA
ncbi:MAG: J domain-containing protein [Gaiellales bacterium]